MDGNQPQPPQRPNPDQQTAEEAAERKARLEYLRNVSQDPERQQKRGLPGWLKVLLTLLIILLLIAGAILVFGQARDKMKNNTSSTKQTASTNTGQAQDKKIPEPTKQFNSDKFNLGFKYPENWKVLANDPNKIVAVSAPVQLTDANGAKTTGQVLLTIAPKGQNLSGFDAGNATAVLDSKKIAYTKPTEVQRGETFISFVQYANTTTKGALDAVLITGDFGYTKGQGIPKTDAQKLDPVVTLTFNKCGDSTCSQVKPTAIQASMWNDNKAFSGPLEKMLASLTVD